MRSARTNFLSRKKQHPGRGAAIKWGERRVQYLSAVRELYRLIETSLAEPIKQKTVRLQRLSRDLTENQVGTYAVEDLLVVIGETVVRFSPRGCYTGAAGHVDVIGDLGRAALIAQPSARWGFQTRQPMLRVVHLDESTLADLFQLVTRDLSLIRASSSGGP